jgi:hypothetical protein
MAGLTGTHGVVVGGVSRTRTARSRGALTGFGLVLLGAWGALIAFVGPYFDYAFTPDKTWTWTAARFWLQVLPGAVTFFAGLILLMTAHRVVASAAAWLAIASGAWFVVGPLLAPLWRANYLGTPVGSRTDVSVEQIGMFYGLGAAIILLAAMAAGRFSVVGVRDLAAATTHAERVAAERDAAERVAADRAAGDRVPAGTTIAGPTAPAETGEPIDLRDGTVREGTVRDGAVRDGAVRDGDVVDTTDAAAPETTEATPHRHRRFVFR